METELTKYYIENPDGINDVNKPYACFHYGIKWIPSDIAGYENANGFIVQSIKIEAPEFLSGYPCKSYYEAWKVVDGTVHYIDKVQGNEDDVFIYPEEGIGESLFRNGKITYFANVYWIDEKSPLFKTVAQWKMHAVQQAGNLLKSSTEFKECGALIPVLVREPFVFQFDFRNETDVYETILNRGRNSYSCNRRTERDNFIGEYRDCFVNKGKEELFLTIESQLRNEFGE